MHPHCTQAPPSLEAEVWRPIPGYWGLYSVSNLGRVRREQIGYRCRYPRGGFIKLWSSDKGYLCLALTRFGNQKRFQVHTLIARTFLGPRPHGCQIHHCDGDKANNAAWNLRYVPPSVNVQHAWDTGLTKRRNGMEHPAAKLTDADVLDIRRSPGRVGRAALARRYGVSKSNIRSVQLRLSWKHLP